MLWGSSGQRGSHDIGSLLDRLEALEETPEFSDPIVTTGLASSEIVAPIRSPGLIRWFTLGFACAFVGGGIVLVALMLVRPAQAKSGLSAYTSTEPMIQSLIPETRQLWWKLPASIDRAGPKLARAHE
jgi:hypothetical protein